jgi:hypothetical protein
MKTSQALAGVVLRAANFREASWDEYAYEKAQPGARRHRDFYGISIYSACELACDKEPGLLPVVFRLLESDFVGSVEWAKKETK